MSAQKIRERMTTMDAEQHAEARYLLGRIAILLGMSKEAN
jgi:hypothetical protein